MRTRVAVAVLVTMVVVAATLTGSGPSGSPESYHCPDLDIESGSGDFWWVEGVPGSTDDRMNVCNMVYGTRIPTIEATQERGA